VAGILFDSSVYIDAQRRRNTSLLAARNFRLEGEKGLRPLWLSAVVLEELLVGAINTPTQKLCLKLERDFTKARRLLVPNRSDWIIAGQVLCEIGKKYGFDEVKGARMTNDTLIAMTVASNGFKIFTKNGKDFARIAEFRPFDWEEI
jgi:predicted nucleic acid-binding protein